MRKIYIVTLTQEERDRLTKMVSSGSAPARKLTRARILLKSNRGPGGPNWTDKAICEALDVGMATVARVRQRFVENGLEDALNQRKPRRKYLRKLDGRAEAHLTKLACSEPPEGKKRWTLRLLADKLVALDEVEVDLVSHETVRQVLKKNELKPWLNKQWVIPPKEDAEFVYRLEDVVDLYHEPYDPKRPIVCFDETSKQLVAEIRMPRPVAPGQVALYDYEYERKGVRNLFLFFDPLAGWRHIKVTERRTKED